MGVQPMHTAPTLNATLHPWAAVQAESGAKSTAELRQQLAARERQLEAQSLAAAEAAGDAARLRGRLEQSEVQLGRVLGERADLEDAGGCAVLLLGLDW